MSNTFIQEAFKQFNLLEDAQEFNMSADSLEEMESFLDAFGDVDDDVIDVADLEAEAEEELKQSYVGKVILDCNVCHSNIFANKDEITIDDETGLVNNEIECPYCMSNEGYKIIGEIAPYSEETPELPIDTESEEELADEPIEVEMNDKKEEVKESFNRKSLKRALKESIDYRDVVEDIADRAIVNMEEGNDLYDAIWDAVDEGLIYYADQWKVVMKYANPSDILFSSENTDIIDAFVDDVRKAVEGGGQFRESLKLDGTEKLRGVKSLKRREDKDGHKGLRGRANSRISGINESKSLKEEQKYDVETPDVIRMNKGMKYTLCSTADGEICKVVDLADAKSQVKELKQDDKKLRKGKKVEYYLLGDDKDTPLGLDGKPLEESLKEGWRGSDEIEMVSNGEWGDPDLVYDGYTFNYWDIEDALWQMFLEDNDKWTDADSNDPQCEAEFNEFVKANAPNYLEDCIYGGYFADGSKSWHDRYNESLKESVVDIDTNSGSTNIETEEELITVDKNEEGGITVNTQPLDDIEDTEGEVIAPLSDESIDEITDSIIDDIESDEEFEDEEMFGDEEEIPVDEFDEEEFDNLGESYLKRCYENVNGFKTSSVTANANQLIVEGVITFDSGNKKNTTFVFNAKTKNANNLKFEGYNKQIAKGHKSFKLGCSLVENKIVPTSLNYNYKSRNELNESIRVYGTVKSKKRV